MDRPALILLPGMPLDAALWEHQTRHLADVADVRVGDVGGAESVAGLAAAVLAAAPPRFALAGLSLGGYVAMEILRQAPQRVDRVALLDTNPYADSAEQSANRRAAVDLARAGRLRHVVAGHLPKLVHPDRLKDRALIDSVYAQAERLGVEAYARQQTAIIGRPDSRDSLRAVRCPALVLCGREDALSGVAVHAEMADLIPGARLAVVEQCGHLAAMEQPQAVTALLRLWLLYG
ncbi:alpha/beta fold hydrolase [Azospirillum sp. A39]|uniref:alpha/beta fold hydrolase n=1 Tax=Azospirillum sp. A39 TaxID=3462279 RepID=UPI0040457621